MIIGESSFYLMCAAGLYLRPMATLVVFVVPFVTIRFLMMAGNWGQHAFVDRDEPDNDFKSSITCINSRYNRRCYNDGYHIIHHIKPTMHFAEMDVEFEENRALYGEIERRVAAYFEQRAAAAEAAASGSPPRAGLRACSRSSPRRTACRTSRPAGKMQPRDAPSWRPRPAVPRPPPV